MSHKPFFCEPLSPLLPFGAHPSPGGGIQFTLFCRHASRVWLLLFKRASSKKPYREIELNPEENRTGDVWYIRVPEAKAGQLYVYRIEGQAPNRVQIPYDAEQWVLDPYAEAVSSAPDWGRAAGIRAGHFPKNGPRFPKGVIVDHAFDWQGVSSPRTPLADSIIYEVHLRGFTAHPGSGVSCPGTYRGFMEKIPYLKELGITAVELMPIHEFDEMEYHHENGKRKKLRNYWGYSTVNFFSPNARYAADGTRGEQVKEFKELVRELHRAGIEVILDVVFNHTAEGGHGGRPLSFKGLEPSIYYMLEDDGLNYKNYTGCGNTVNCNHPITRMFILHCLRHWVLHYHIDGFRFDLASIFARGVNGDVLPNPPIVEAIAEDPVLRGTKLIAEAWDAAGLYQVGSFPHTIWSEWNGRYRDDVRNFWRGGPGLLSGFATRLSGSGDLYDHSEQSPLKSINFVTSHDGFTMADLVSYNDKHNEANMEENRDGDNHNHSYNHGAEGPTDDLHIRAIRKRQVKNMMASLLCSQGVPMLLAGDEFFRTQRGSNNAYCQDNEVSWVDWSLTEKHRDLVAFVKKAIAFRRAHPSLRRRSFLRGNLPEHDGSDIVWRSPDGHEPIWDNAEALACILNGSKHYTGADEDKDHLFLLFNAHDHRTVFTLPLPPGAPWKVALTTEEKEPVLNADHEHIELDAYSVAVLSSKHQTTETTD